MSFDFDSTGKYVAHAGYGYQLFEAPKYTWQWCFDGEWTWMVNVVKPPCRFYRIAQRLILGIHWRKIP